MSISRASRRILLTALTLLLIAAGVSAQEDGSQSSATPPEGSGQQVMMAWINTTLESASVDTYVSYFNLRFARSAWQQQAVNERTFKRYIRTQRTGTEVRRERFERLLGLLQEDDPFRSEVDQLKGIFDKLHEFQAELLKLPAREASESKLDTLQTQIEDRLDSYFGVDKPEPPEGAPEELSPEGGGE